MHNGSVPNLAALLDSRLRPRFWRHVTPQDYDHEVLGWRSQTLEAGKAAAQTAEERKRIYDTTLPGYGNAGHTFADRLSDTQRQALLEYLKTL